MGRIHDEALRELFEEYAQSPGRSPFEMRFETGYEPKGREPPPRSSTPSEREGWLEEERDKWKKRALEAEKKYGQADRRMRDRESGLCRQILDLQRELARRSVGPAPALSRALVTRLLTYVHPDVNDGSIDAKELTQILLALRPPK